MINQSGRIPEHRSPASLPPGGNSVARTFPLPPASKIAGRIFCFPFARVLLLLAFAVVSPWLNLLGVPSLYAQQPPVVETPSTRLARIEFEGLHRLTKEQLQKVSGLEIGQNIDVAGLDAAGQRLMDSGLIKKLGYRFQAKANQATVTFEIEEGGGLESPVIFDNFIWFTEDELGDAVRREVPSFNGMAVSSGNMTDAIARALQNLLRAHKLPGTVEYQPSENLDHKLEHIFVVRDVSLHICTLHFPGARSIEEERLIKSSQELVGTEYSRRLASSFAVVALFPFYREMGHLRASFGQPQARVITSATAPTANCKDGVEVTIPIEEGGVYSWEKSEWSGNHVLAQEALDAALGMKTGELANGLKLDKGIAAVSKAYGPKGYMGASVRAEPEFDDSARKVSYRLIVKEGPQYHMGNLVITGFSQNLGNYLRGKWELKGGEVYDSGYAENFFQKEFPDVLRKVMEERQEQGKLAPKKINTATRANIETLTVDVTFEIVD
jgi:outer membrane protein assembly factor BamA